MTAEKQSIMIERLRKRILGYPPFMVGDIIRVKPESKTTIPRIGDGPNRIATIVIITPLWPRDVNDYYAYTIGLEFHNKNELLHSLGGQCEEGHGWWAPAYAIELLQRAEDREDE